MSNAAAAKQARKEKKAIQSASRLRSLKTKSIQLDYTGSIARQLSEPLNQSLFIAENQCKRCRPYRSRNITGYSKDAKSAPTVQLPPPPPLVRHTQPETMNSARPRYHNQQHTATTEEKKEEKEEEGMNKNKKRKKNKKEEEEEEEIPTSRVQRIEPKGKLKLQHHKRQLDFTETRR